VRPNKVRARTLADVARPETAPRTRQCRICLADEVLGPQVHTVQHRDAVTGRRWTEEVPVSSLRKGICADRAACESRQPPLIPLEPA
jgi:hypothetical protein